MRIRKILVSLFSNDSEQLRPDICDPQLEKSPVANPDVMESEQASDYRVLSLAAVVQIKLTAFCEKDRNHLRDLIDVGLLDATWLSRLPDSLAQRLKQLLIRRVGKGAHFSPI